MFSFVSNFRFTSKSSQRIKIPGQTTDEKAFFSRLFLLLLLQKCFRSGNCHPLQFLRRNPRTAHAAQVHRRLRRGLHTVRRTTHRHVVRRVLQTWGRACWRAYVREMTNTSNGLKILSVIISLTLSSSLRCSRCYRLCEPSLASGPAA